MVGVECLAGVAIGCAGLGALAVWLVLRRRPTRKSEVIYNSIRDVIEECLRLVGQGQVAAADKILTTAISKHLGPIVNFPSMAPTGIAVFEAFNAHNLMTKRARVCRPATCEYLGMAPSGGPLPLHEIIFDGSYVSTPAHPLVVAPSSQLQPLPLTPPQDLTLVRDRVFSRRFGTASVDFSVRIREPRPDAWFICNCSNASPPQDFSVLRRSHPRLQLDGVTDGPADPKSKEAHFVAKLSSLKARWDNKHQVMSDLRAIFDA